MTPGINRTRTRQCVGLGTWVLMILGRLCIVMNEGVGAQRVSHGQRWNSYYTFIDWKPHREEGRDLWTCADVIEGYGSIFGIGDSEGGWLAMSER